MTLAPAVACLLFAALFGVIAMQVKLLAVQLFAALACAILGITGGLLAWDWLAGRVADNTAAIRAAMAITPASKLAEAMANLEEWQVDGLRRFGVTTVGIVNPDDTPAWVIRAPNSDVPLDFASEFLAMTVYPHLCPVRHYSEGSRERAWAQALTDLCVIHGWASPAVGNRSAALVVPLSEVERRLGL